MSRAQDVRGVLRGLQIVMEASRKQSFAHVKRLWDNSSLKEIVQSNQRTTQECVSRFTSDPGKELEKIRLMAKETFERSAVVVEGIKQLSAVKFKETTMRGSSVGSTAETERPERKLDPSKLDISSITLKELEQLLTKHNKNSQISLRLGNTKEADEKPSPLDGSSKTETKASQSKISLDATENDETYLENVLRTIAGSPRTDPPPPSHPSPHPSPSPHPPPSPDPAHLFATESIELPVLSNLAKQRKVPSSRIGRLASFGSLFAGLGLGTVNELTKGALGLGGAKDMKEAIFSPANAQRIVDTLCKVRGAALKLGQILSIQDSNIVAPELAKAFERVRQAADYMPDWQVEKVMTGELGTDWRDKFQSFDQMPFAAASIGQVHRGVSLDGIEVAVKIQYPGIAKGIESDIDNLVGLLKVWNVFPAGFYIDNVVKVAKRELNWEVDYIREAEYTEKFGEMIRDSPEYRVPKVIKDLSTKSVLTTELVPGLPLDKCFEMNYDDRKFIATAVLQLCLRELFDLECMQTDPNWSNFLYDRKSRKLMLIDFGSTRFYAREFIQKYRRVIVAAIDNNRSNVLQYSRDIGFLTGYESKQMEEAHIDAVMILGEMFRYPGEFDFGTQNTTKRIAQLVPRMVANRLCPPPEEIYSIHRKLSGVFLLCARLNVKIDCRPFSENIQSKI